MKRLFFLSLIFLLVPIHAASQAFQPGCQLKGHLRTLAQNRAIDNTCPRQGRGQPPSLAQNRAKNNFCAPNVPVEVTVPVLRTLDARTQTALRNAGIPFGTPTSIPPDRARLEQGFTIDGQLFKEGMAVFLRAFVLESHYSNLGNGENVNCSIGKKLNNDIHISLARNPDDDECEGVTAEISPHKRPATWADFDDYLFTHPVMLMGHLFYDASHVPCTPGQRRRPFRSSSWEIHPVYSIFVCKNPTLNQCPADPTSSSWVRFDRWVDLPNDEEEGHHGVRRKEPFWAVKELLYQSESSIWES